MEDSFERTLYSYTLYIWTLSAIVTMPFLFLTPAPYGKFTRSGYGPILSSRLGWILQEIPSFFLFAGYYYFSPRKELQYTVLSVMYLIHFGNRAFIYPYYMRNRKSTTFSVLFSSIIFTTANSYLLARGLLYFDPPIDSSFFRDETRYIGIMIWLTGFYINIRSDSILRNLRKPGESKYKMPFGGMFEYVSAANYLGETIEWIGFAIAVQNHSAFAFALWTFANLLPRSLSQHKWYLDNFADYRKLDRRAFIPFIL
jgi:3-oxo-5-alpha-steroid 4-dehydrogenase 1